MKQKGSWICCFSVMDYAF